MKRVELRHDLIARKVYELFSDEDKEVMGVQKALRDRAGDYAKRGGALLAESDYEYFKQFEERIEINPDIQRFLEESGKQLERKKWKKRGLTLVGAVLIFALGISIAFIVMLGNDEAKERAFNILIFKAIDQGKSNGIMNEFAKGSDASARLDSLDAEVADLEREIVDSQLETVSFSIKYKDKKLAKEHLQDRLTSLRNSLSIAEKKKKAYRNKLQNSSLYPSVNFEQISSVLGGNEILIEFFTINEEDLYAWVLTSTSGELIRIGEIDPVLFNLARLKQEYLKPMQNLEGKRDLRVSLNSETAFVHFSSQLYQLLWEPLRKSGIKAGKDLIIIPAQELATLPFEILIPENKRKNYTEYDYLVKDHTISYHLSAAHFYWMRKINTQNQYNQDLLGLIQTQHQSVEKESGPVEVSKVAPLIDSLYQYFGKEAININLNKSAKEEHLYQVGASEYRYILISTFGKGGEGTSSRFLQLQATDSVQNGNEDGSLFPNEVLLTNLNAEVVVLAAGESGLGINPEGGSNYGFRTAFLSSGSRGVITSLWMVYDTPTNKLFQMYFKTLSQDRSDTYLPLRKAQLEMIESKEYSNPYLWAPFIFTGNRYPAEIEP